jgi:acyl-CoA synthetase (AMP-forming)/AMP-acid ligase II
VHFQISEFGRIHDVARGQNWGPERLSAEVDARTATLSAAGIKPGSLIAIAHSGSARFFADLFATWRRGCTAVCIDTKLTASEIRTLVDFAEPAALLIDNIEPAILTQVPVLDLARDSSTAHSSPEPVGDPDSPALVLFTSGTTGIPKGVVLSFRALLNRVTLNRAAMGAASRAKTLVTLPTSFGHGLIGNALTPLMAGGDIVLHSGGLELAKNLGRVVDEFGIRFLSSVPSFWRMALKFSNAPSGNTLVRIHVGSAPLPVELWTQIVAWARTEVVNCYGITELANWVAGASSQIDGISEGLVGKPWGDVVAVKDGRGDIRNCGDGELLVKSRSAMSEYLRRPDQTAAAFVDGWYMTGDTGHIDKAGLIRLTGRIKDEINRAGVKVQPAEIDALLETHPGVSEACVFGIPDRVSGEIVAAAVHFAPGGTVDVEALREWCTTKVRRDAIPEKWFVTEKLPRNERGKINRQAVRRMLVGGSNDP